ncbi:MaoC family dehydratase [Rhodococcus sp. USK10]|uniref:MaoC family dehydratase n=1 Tax=Rhodococcus sp. USK10 TaxID=2789739 RepID=UPI001C5E1F4D|nr:MaoC family dehydratase [Rhodococcus sp. USK10]QYB06913.1 MaoC family dehydratase [Rhodococcus sp. USK10]
MRVFDGNDDILGAVGETLGTSDWTTITQEQVDTFADATGDHQWIHVDVDRATRESPFGGPVAHGYLTLSLVPMFGQQIYRVANAKMGVNYGSNKVRFPSPVPVGSKVRSTAVLTEATAVSADVVQMVVTHTVEVDGVSKPALVAESVSRVYF